MIYILESFNISTVFHQKSWHFGLLKEGKPSHGRKANEKPLANIW